MRTPEQVRWDFVEQWLERAARNLDAARILLRDRAGDASIVAFHAQQTAEMALKALLVRYQVELPKTHEVGRLRGLIQPVAPEVSDRVAEADDLTPYAVEHRYPGSVEEATRADAERALRIAERTREVVIDHLESYLSAGRPTP
jgi:HEPN domain-containing protein